MNSATHCSACQRNLSSVTKIVEKDGGAYCSRRCANIRKIKSRRDKHTIADSVSFLFRFSGRISRTGFWSFFGVMLFALSIAGFFDWQAVDMSFPICTILTFAIFSWPNLALLTKRLHDRGWSGLWILLTFLPYIGIPFLVWLFIEAMLPGEFGTNRYGLDTHKNYRYEQVVSPGLS